MRRIFSTALLCLSSTALLAAGLDDDLSGMSFRCIGPFRGGRATAVTGVRGMPDLFYFGGTGGGVWKTTDAGASWEPISDKSFKTGSVGAIAVAESDPNVIYVGMGEAPIRGNVSRGDGVYRSTDAGKSWKNVGLGNSSQISRILVHPTDPNLVYVAAQGRVFSSNEERGVFRSADGGKTWKRVLFVDDRTGASDLSMDPHNPRILFAGMWQVHRKPWTLESGGPGSGLHRSTDGGDTWKKLAGGLPEGLVGKVGVSVSPAREGIVYAIVEAEKGGVFRSDDGGEKWKRVNEERKLRQRAWYFSGIFADPKSADVVYVANVRFYRSGDGGKTYTRIRTPHGDNHDLWIDPDDPGRMIEGNDGGATVTKNGGRTWSAQDNQPTAQFYRVTTDDRTPYWVYGAQQDNSDVAVPSAARGTGLSRQDWYPAGGGESGFVTPKPGDPEVIYGGSYGGSINRYDHRTGESREINAYPEVIDGQAIKDLRYRFNWNAPIAVSPHDPNVLYHGSQHVLRSTDEGQSWDEISPDLTRNDRSKQEASGGPITKDVTGTESFDTVFYIVESPHEKGTIWAGTDDGLVQLTRDGGKTWKNVTPAGLPEWIQINAIDVSPHEKGAAYVAATLYKMDDVAPYLYKTTDYGKTWTKITTGIPNGAFTRVVREDPSRRGLLYAGTETGIYVSLDDGASWVPFQRNLPVVPVTDLRVKEKDLVVATQGRAFWILDDLTPLHQWSDTVRESSVLLMKPRPSYRPFWENPDEKAPPRPVGQNPPAGVLVNYWLKVAPKAKEKLTIEILDGAKVLRTFTNEKKEEKPDKDAEGDDEGEKPLEPKAGLNRFVWDMKLLEPTIVAPKEIFGDFPPEGPRVAPGTYRVRLTSGTTVLEDSFEILPHPKLGTSAADLKEQAELLAKLRDDLDRAHETVKTLRDLKAQVKGIADRAPESAGLRKPAEALTAKLTAVEEKLINPKLKADQDSLNFKPGLDFQISGLAGAAGSAEARPTEGVKKRYKDLKAQLDAVMGEVKALVDGDVAAFNGLVAEKKVPPVMVKEKKQQP